jgi:hypothetical protein
MHRPDALVQHERADQAVGLQLQRGWRAQHAGVCEYL